MSVKPVLRSTLRMVESEVRSITGRNLRSILSMTDRSTIHQLCPADMDCVKCHGEPEPWRILRILEILQIRAGEIEIPGGWEREQLEEILKTASCS